MSTLPSSEARHAGAVGASPMARFVPSRTATKEPARSDANRAARMKLAGLAL